ncbi:hypothetical protein C5O13_01230 [Akkermansia muciniphila]|nr:hypothetical protein CUB89_05675 [Akkermansia muciniphila]QHV22634.1 hypothetical protein C5O13_01230 [Akkermansia muciniphila]
MMIFSCFFPSFCMQKIYSGAGCFPGAGHRKVPNAGKDGMSLFCLIARQKKGRPFSGTCFRLGKGSAIRQGVPRYS